MSDASNKFLVQVITGIVSLMAGILIEKFKNRTSCLKYNISFQPLATSSETAYWGKIQVYHNQRLTQHLNFITLEIENTSNTDHQNLHLLVTCDDRSQFLAQSGFYNDNKNISIQLEQEYYVNYNDINERFYQDEQTATLNPHHVRSEELTNDIKWVVSNKRFNLPVLNRRSKVTINLLTENFDGKIPVITPGIVHKSVRLVPGVDFETELREQLIAIVIISLSICVTSSFFIYHYFPASATPITLTLCATIGVNIASPFIYSLYRLFRRLLV
jgi:hypothetical protein